METKDFTLHRDGVDGDFDVTLYGTAGRPVIVFPEGDSSCSSWEDGGMIDALAGLINAGRVRFFCVDSADGSSWYAGYAPTEYRLASLGGYFDLVENDLAQLVREEAPGYGSALRAGIRAARAPVILMGDCDTTYDFMQLGLLYAPLAEGRCDVIVGDRFAGGIEPGAMPLSHRWGVTALSALARLRFRTDVRDFHCGLRGLTRAAAERMELQTDGMEFATELIAEAARRGLRIGQAPVRLRRCTLERSSKLRTIRDGFRHLGFILRG